jgi:molybdopterin converting factor small subunit
VDITVRSVGPIRQLLGQAEVALTVPDGTTVSGLLALLAEEKGEKLAPYAIEPKEPSAYAPLRVVVNGRDLLPRQYREVILKKGDDVLIFTPIAGG